MPKYEAERQNPAGGSSRRSQGMQAAEEQARQVHVVGRVHTADLEWGMEIGAEIALKIHKARR